MKLSLTILLLVAGSFCLFRGCSARVDAIPLSVLQTLKNVHEEIKPVYEHIEPVHEEIEPIHEEIEPYHEEIEPVHEEIMPIHEEIQPIHEEIEPYHEEIEPYHEEIEPIHEEIEPYHEEIEPVHEEIKPIHEGIEPVYEDIKPIDESADVPIEPVELPEERAGECKITIRGGIADPQPVFLKTDAAEFYPYSDTGVMIVDSGKTLQMWCPSNFKSFAKTLITASCVSGTTFKVDGTSYDFKEFVCKSWPSFVAKKTGASCNGGIMVRVGFEVSSSRFVEQMTVCFNEDEEVTRYVHHELNPGSNYYQTGVDRLTFQTAGFFGGKNVDNLYTQNTQLETINKELGGDADKYFNSKSNVYLARGHMAAKADFDYGTQQRATFLFINAAPQWQTFNAGNWARVEDGVRAYVSKNKLYVDCYTGVWGVTTLPNTRGVQTPLYLAYDSNNNGLIPVPKLYFRVVIDRSSKKGIVFIGVNNPHLTLEEIKKDYIICPDVSDKVDYINWKKTDIATGYSYACEVSEFTKVVKYLPSLSASGGLLL